MTMFHKQRGFLLISATILIVVIVGMLGGLIAYFALTSSYSVLNQQRMNRAHYIAESGLRTSLYAMLKNDVDCNDLSAQPELDNVAFGNGKFDVTASEYFPNPPAVLTADISSAVTTIPVSNLTNYSPIGRVIIDNEAINYGATSTDAATCGGLPPCLTGAQRGTSGSTAQAHSVGTWVNQNLCYITSLGAIPDFTNPLTERQISEGVLIGFGGGFISGGATSSATILYWDGTEWVNADLAADVPKKALNDIVILTLFNSWAVGNKVSGPSNGANIIHWNGITWSPYVNTLPNEDLNAITCLEDNDCWAVGNGSTFLHYNGSTWTSIIASGLPNKTINDISCADTDDCFAVGNADAGTPLVVRWNGVDWTRMSMAGLPAESLNAIDCVTTNDCWASGTGGKFFHYNGSNWSLGTTSGVPGTATVNGLDCLTPTDCWAVGDQSGPSLFIRYQGGIWSRFTLDAAFPVKKFLDVSCADPNDCWASANSDNLARWNGITWALVVPNVSTPNIPLTSIAIIKTGFGRLKFWNE